MRAALLHPSAKPIAFMLGLLPLLSLLLGAATAGLGANPAETLIRATGDWTLRMLCVTLAITPLRMVTATPQWLRFRRMAGLFTYFYACLHLFAYGWLDMGLVPADIARDIVKRPFILVGMTGWTLLTALAITSPKRILRWMGARRWQALHRSVYAVALLAVLHFYWMRAAKGNLQEVAVYGAVLAGLLGWRIWHARAGRPMRPAG